MITSVVTHLLDPDMANKTLASLPTVCNSFPWLEFKYKAVMILLDTFRYGYGMILHLLSFILEFCGRCVCLYLLRQQYVVSRGKIQEGRHPSSHFSPSFTHFA